MQESTAPPGSAARALSRYREYLLYYYHNDPIVRDDKLSIAPCSQFINLALISKSKATKKDDTLTKATFHGGVDQIIASKSPLELDDILKPGFHFVLVEGPPGIGKSTLCWELCREWDTLKSFRGYKIVLQLKLRERRVQKATSLTELFYHEDEKLRKSVVRSINKCEGKGVLLVLDGFDEIPGSAVREENSLIMRLIGGKCLPLATRLVTSRPSALHRTKYFPREYRHIEILGFTDEHKRQFAEIAFESEPELLSHFMNFVFSNPVINSLMYIPVNCAIIAQVYKDIKGSNIMPKTMTQLYTTLTLVLIRRYMIEKGIWDEDSRIPTSIEDLPQKVLEELRKVGELAHRGLFQDDMQLIFFDSDIPEGVQYLGLLKESKEMYVSEGVRTFYSFLHLSIQEFLAAWHVSCHSDLIDGAISKTFDNPGTGSDVKPHLDAFGRFLAGMIGCSKFPVEFKPSEYMDTSRYIINCFYEAQDSSYLNSFPANSLWRVSLSSPLDMYMFGYTLVHAPIEWKISIFTDFAVLIRSLADSMPPNGQILGSIEGLILHPKDMKINGSIDYLLLQLEELPLELLAFLKLENISNSTISVLSRVITLFPNLQRLALNFERSCKEDTLIYRMLKYLKNLKEIEISFLIMTTKGVHEVSKFVSSSQTLQSVRIHALNEAEGMFRKEEYEYHSLIEAVLSCSTVKLLSTNIPFKYCSSRTFSEMEDLTFEVPLNHFLSLVRLHDCLCSIADMCKMPSMKNLRIVHDVTQNTEDILFEVYSDFMAILNDSLHCNSSMEELLLLLEFKSPDDRAQHIYSSIFSLGRDPDSLRTNLRRSRSLCELRTTTAGSDISLAIEDDELMESEYNLDGPETSSENKALESEKCSLNEETEPLVDLAVAQDEGLDGSFSEDESLADSATALDEDLYLENRSSLGSFCDELSISALERSVSCPDLMEVQCVQKMHLMLYEVLTSDEQQVD